jgi:type VI secretion system protein ImpA
VGLINIESLTKPIEGDNPSGENLRWDRAYLELETVAKGKEETQYQAGEEPDWREVRDKSVELLARGRHLRLGILLTLSAVRLEGFAGLRDGLAVIRAWLEQQWDTVWPVLDAEDNNDPTERVNSLAALATPLFTFGDTTKLLDRVYESPICESRQLGMFSLKDIAIAAGTLEAPPAKEGAEQKPVPTLDVIDGAFAETDKERLEEIAKAAEEADQHAQAISDAFERNCGTGIGPDVTGLKTILKDAVTQIRRRLGQVAPEEGGPAGGGEEGGGGSGAAISGDVRNSRDALMALDKIIHYFEVAEPSSPVPLICRGAQRMVGKNFAEIVRVLTPDVVTTLENIAGVSQASE